MPDRNPYMRVTARGVFGWGEQGVNEEWTCSLSLVSLAGAPIGSLVTDAEMDGIRLAWSDWIERSDSKQATHTALTEVRCALIGPDNRVARDPDSGAFIQRIRVLDPEDNHGLSTTSFLPYQITWAVSLVTNRAGPTGKGRMFLPSPCTTVAADGLWTEGTVALFLSSAATLLGDINEAAPAGIGVGVSSSKGYDTPVVSIRGGRVPDTQRRRRRSLDEGYLTNAIVLNT